MRNRNLSIVTVAMLVTRLVGVSQEQPQETEKKEMPKLEIPEITIVGKKAITLPFARKGEVYDVSIYEAPPPDSSLLGEPPMMAPPIGSLPRYADRLAPWRFAAEGSVGSFAEAHLRGHLGYETPRWGIAGRGDYSATNGHTSNASASAAEARVKAHSAIRTDNELLKMFRVGLGSEFVHESYGMFGLPDPSARRKRAVFDLNVDYGSLQRKVSALDVSFNADITTVTDDRASADSQATIVSPALKMSYATNIGNVRLISEFLTRSSSLDYQRPIQSPSLLSFSAGARWQTAGNWSIQVGGMVARGTEPDGGSKTLFAPIGIVRWGVDSRTEFSVWFQPELSMLTYGEQMLKNPYLIREITLRPQRRPIQFGGTMSFESRLVSLEILGSFARGSNQQIAIADSGRIELQYVDASQSTLQGNGTLRLTGNTRLTFSGTVHPAFENGSSTQLPMIALVQLGGRGELTFEFPVMLWSSLEYWSKQNVNLAGDKTLGDRVLIGVGATTRLIPQTIVSLEVSNVLNTAYEWWSSYAAPGRRFTVGARVSL